MRTIILPQPIKNGSIYGKNLYKGLWTMVPGRIYKCYRTLDSYCSIIPVHLVIGISMMHKSLIKRRPFNRFNDRYDIKDLFYQSILVPPMNRRR